MAFGRLRGLRVAELKSSGGMVYSVQSTLLEAGGRSPGRVLRVTPWGLLPSWQFPTHANSCGLAGHRPAGCVSNAPRWTARLVRPGKTGLGWLWPQQPLANDLYVICPPPVVPALKVCLRVCKQTNPNKFPCHSSLQDGMLAVFLAERLNS